MAEEPQPRKARRVVLDEARRNKIIALLSNGASRRTAAYIVGCAPSTITRAAARDAQFREQLALAERSLQVEALRSIRSASRKERYWRAAAWILERKFPEEFGPRQPTALTKDEIAEILTNLASMLMDKLPADNVQRAMQFLKHLTETQDKEMLESVRLLIAETDVPANAD